MYPLHQLKITAGRMGGAVVVLASCQLPVVSAWILILFCCKVQQRHLQDVYFRAAQRRRVGYQQQLCLSADSPSFLQTCLEASFLLLFTICVLVLCLFHYNKLGWEMLQQLCRTQPGNGLNSLPVFMLNLHGSTALPKLKFLLVTVPELQC